MMARYMWEFVQVVHIECLLEQFNSELMIILHGQLILKRHLFFLRLNPQVFLLIVLIWQG